MRNIWTIAKKELRSYFDHPTAYILLVVFLVLNFFFYFRSALLVQEASVRAMFDLLPWILLFFVPAATMSAVAEERRRGTLEVLLSHPIQAHELLLGKYLGNVLFVGIALLATIVAPLSLYLSGNPDFGVVVAQYVGGLLLVGAMVAIGIAASALTRNQITAFILGTVAIFVLMLLGSEIVQIGLPAWLNDVLGQLGIMPHFQNVTRGVLDLRDVVYFLSVIIAFLALAYWLLSRDRLNRSARLYRNLRLGTAMIVAIAVVANLFGSYIPGRIDLTAENLYTLSDGTKGILEDLDDVVTMTLFVSEELPAQVELTKRDVSDVLRDFRRFSDGNVQVVERNPDDSEETRQEAQRLGIPPVQFNVVRREEFQVKQGWLGIAVRYADETETIPFVGDTRTLEYELASYIWKLTRSETPTVAFVTGHGEQTARDHSSFRDELGRSYRIETVDLSPDADSVPDALDADAVILAGPGQALDARTRRLLRDYMADDGRLLYLGEGVNINLQFLMANPVPDSARDFVRDLGVRMNGDLVYDLRSNAQISMPGRFMNYVVPYPFWVRATPSGEHAITRDLNSVLLPWPSSLDTTAATGGREVSPLLTTTEYGGRQVGNFQIRPDQQLDVQRENLTAHVLAFAVQGGSAPAEEQTTRVDEAEAGRAELEGDGGDGDASTAGTDGGSDGPEVARPVAKQVVEGALPGRAVVVGDADFLTERFAQNNPENIAFALNAVDWLTQTEALMSIRSKTPTPRQLVFDPEWEKQVIKYLNLVGVPLAFVVLGIVRLLGRRRVTRQSYGS